MPLPLQSRSGWVWSGWVIACIQLLLFRYFEQFFILSNSRWLNNRTNRTDYGPNVLLVSVQCTQVPVHECQTEVEAKYFKITCVWEGIRAVWMDVLQCDLMSSAFFLVQELSVNPNTQTTLKQLPSSGLLSIQAPSKLTCFDGKPGQYLKREISSRLQCHRLTACTHKALGIGARCRCEALYVALVTCQLVRWVVYACTSWALCSAPQKSARLSGRQQLQTLSQLLWCGNDQCRDGHA